MVAVAVALCIVNAVLWATITPWMSLAWIALAFASVKIGRWLHG